MYKRQDQQKAFYNYWTQKEAVVKAHGKGLSIPLQSFEIKDNTTIIDTKTFYASKINLEEKYMCYVAYGQEINKDNIIIKRIDMDDILSSVLM